MTSPTQASKVPLAILPIYDKLRSEITWLHARWLTYRELFAESPRRIDLLNESAGFFFYILQEVLLDEVQVCLSKLTDPAEQGKSKNQNLSLEQLHATLLQHGDAALATTCRTILDKLQTQCELFRHRRNKELAHLDLPTALKQLPTPIPGVSRQMIEDALLSVREMMNAIEGHYNDSQYGYEHFVSTSGASALLAVLRNGLRYEELVQERALPHGDWRKGQWADA